MRTRMTKALRVLVPVLLPALWLGTGCGGGPGDGDGGIDLGETGDLHVMGDMNVNVDLGDMRVPHDMAPPPPPDGMARLSGAAAKGPLVLGSPVDVSPVDSTGNPTGQVFQTQTTDDEGRFSLVVPPVGLAQVRAKGFYYNEISGGLSQADLTLLAFADISEARNQDAFINLVTHLSFLRTKKLLGDGKSLAEASAQAEQELRGELQIGGPSFDPGVAGNQMSLLGGDDKAGAYVFALASVFVRSAMIKGGGSVEAVLQERVNTIQSGFAASGKLDQASKDLLRRAQACVRPSDAMSKLQKRFDAISSDAVAPDINRALDSDGDGVPNAEDDCLRVANPDQSPITDRVCASSVDSAAGPAVPLGATVWLRATDAAHDLDGNGKPDVVLVASAYDYNHGAQAASAIAWLNPGTGLGTPVTTDLAARLGTTSTGMTLWQARLADLDGDGKADLALSYSKWDQNRNPGYPQLVYLPGDGAGHFSAPVTMVAGIDPYLCGGRYCDGATPYCSGGTCVQGCGSSPPCGPGTTCTSALGPSQCVANCGSSGPCGMNQTCVAGACQDNCPIAPCAAGQSCVNHSQCLDNCGSGPPCDSRSGEFCVDGACVQGCGSNPPCADGATCMGSQCETACGSGWCTADQACVGGTTCKHKCASGPCADGQVCDYGTNTCVASCGGTTCPFAQGCVNGACVDRCGPVPPCPPMSTCDPDLGPAPCGAGQACGGDQACHDKCGSGPPCNLGTYCVSGSCVSGCGPNPPCGAGEVCQGASCLAQCGGTTCNPNQVCVSDTCKDVCVGGQPCPDGQSCTSDQNGQRVCRPSCGGTTCNAGETCSGGMCKCGSGSSCGYAQSCVAGACAADCGSGGPCTAGQLCVYGACVASTYSGVVDFMALDVNGDGRLDLVGTAYAVPLYMSGGVRDPSRVATVQVLLRQSDGSYARAVPVPISTVAGSDAVDLAAADLDGDGKPELVVSCRVILNTSGLVGESYTLALLENDGHGGYTLVANSALAGPWNERVAFRFGDVDGDGKLDLAVLDVGPPVFGGNPAKVTVYFGDGAGGLGATVKEVTVPTSAAQSLYADCPDAAPPALSTNTYAGEFELADLNGDGKADLFVGDAVFLSTGRDFAPLGRLEGSGDGGTMSGNTGAIGGLDGAPPPLASGPRTADLDGDGKAEVLAPGSAYDGNPTVTTAPVTLQVGRVNPSGVHTW